MPQPSRPKMRAESLRVLRSLGRGESCECEHGPALRRPGFFSLRTCGESCAFSLDEFDARVACF